MNKYDCSDGSKVSQATIDARLKKAYRDHDIIMYCCEACHRASSIGHDHTISQKRCKELHKTELIWYSKNWSYSCRKCHMEWESYKSGSFQHHDNVVRRMLFMQEHDQEGYKKRITYITEESILNILETEF